MATTYCDAVKKSEVGEVHRKYHDGEYGFPIHDDDALFGRLILEINQAGLSWTTILNKKDNFHDAYDGFRIEKVAAYKQRDIMRLLNNAGIIRNRLKIEAAIYNAGRIEMLQLEFGSFENWLDYHHPKTKEQWVKLFKDNFRFTGGEIVNEFLMSIGYLPGAHQNNCPVYKKVLKHKPAWYRKK